MISVEMNSASSSSSSTSTSTSPNTSTNSSPSTSNGTKKMIIKKLSSSSNVFDVDGDDPRGHHHQKQHQSSLARFDTEKFFYFDNDNNPKQRSNNVMVVNNHQQNDRHTDHQQKEEDILRQEKPQFKQTTAAAPSNGMHQRQQLMQLTNVVVAAEQTNTTTTPLWTPSCEETGLDCDNETIQTTTTAAVVATAPSTGKKTTDINEQQASDDCSLSNRSVVINNKTNTDCNDSQEIDRIVENSTKIKDLIQSPILNKGLSPRLSRMINRMTTVTNMKGTSTPTSGTNQTSFLTDTVVDNNVGKILDFPDDDEDDENDSDEELNALRIRKQKKSVIMSTTSQMDMDRNSSYFPTGSARARAILKAASSIQSSANSSTSTTSSSSSSSSSQSSLSSNDSDSSNDDVLKPTTANINRRKPLERTSSFQYLSNITPPPSNRKSSGSPSFNHSLSRGSACLKAIQDQLKSTLTSFSPILTPPNASNHFLTEKNAPIPENLMTPAPTPKLSKSSLVSILKSPTTANSPSPAAGRKKRVIFTEPVVSDKLIFDSTKTTLDVAKPSLDDVANVTPSKGVKRKPLDIIVGPPVKKPCDSTAVAAATSETDNNKNENTTVRSSNDGNSKTPPMNQFFKIRSRKIGSPKSFRNLFGNDGDDDEDNNGNEEESVITKTADQETQPPMDRDESPKEKEDTVEQAPIEIESSEPPPETIVPDEPEILDDENSNESIELVFSSIGDERDEEQNSPTTITIEDVTDEVKDERNNEAIKSSTMNSSYQIEDVTHLYSPSSPSDNDSVEAIPLVEPPEIEDVTSEIESEKIPLAEIHIDEEEDDIQIFQNKPPSSPEMIILLDEEEEETKTDKTQNDEIQVITLENSNNTESKNDETTSIQQVFEKNQNAPVVPESPIKSDELSNHEELSIPIGSCESSPEPPEPVDDISNKINEPVLIGCENVGNESSQESVFGSTDSSSSDAPTSMVIEESPMKSSDLMSEDSSSQSSSSTVAAQSCSDKPIDYSVSTGANIRTSSSPFDQYLSRSMAILKAVQDPAKFEFSPEKFATVRTQSSLPSSLSIIAMNSSSRASAMLQAARENRPQFFSEQEDEHRPATPPLPSPPKSILRTNSEQSPASKKNRRVIFSEPVVSTELSFDSSSSILDKNRMIFNPKIDSCDSSSIPPSAAAIADEPIPKTVEANNDTVGPNINHYTVNNESKRTIDDDSQDSQETEVIPSLAKRRKLCHQKTTLEDDDGDEEDRDLFKTIPESQDSNDSSWGKDIRSMIMQNYETDEDEGAVFFSASYDFHLDNKNEDDDRQHTNTKAEEEKEKPIDDNRPTSTTISPVVVTPETEPEETPPSEQIDEENEYASASGDCLNAPYTQKYFRTADISDDDDGSGELQNNSKETSDMDLSSQTEYSKSTTDNNNVTVTNEKCMNDCGEKEEEKMVTMTMPISLARKFHSYLTKFLQIFDQQELTEKQQQQQHRDSSS